MHKRSRTSVATASFALLTALSTLALGASSARAQDVAIGFNADQSGSGAAELGVAARYGFELAIEDVNKAGGLLGKKVRGLVRDDTGQPPKSIQNMTELLDSEKVVGVVGPTNSGSAVAWMHIVQQKKVPVLVPLATATELTTKYAGEPQNYIFRVSMVDRDQSALLIAYAVKASKNHKIALIGDSTGFGQQGVKDLAAVLALHGEKPVAIEKFGPKDTDMSSQLSKIRDAGADTVVLYGLADANAQVLRSMDKIGYAPVTLGNWSNMSTPLLNTAGKRLAERLIFSTSTSEDSSPRATALASRVRERYPQLATFVAAAQSYDCVMLLASAITKAGTTDGDKVAAVLDGNLPDTQGVVKLYRKPFSKTNHEALSVADFRLGHWQDGKVVAFSDAITKSLVPADLLK